MAISKIILNGVTQMDLTADTVAASNLIAPNTAHGADGEAVVGTASGGTDFIVTLSYNSTTGNWEPDKTLSEIQSAYNNGKTIATKVDENEEGLTFGYFSDEDSTFYYFVDTINYSTNELTNGYYSLDSNGISDFGAMTYITPPTGSLNITTNGTHDVTNYASANVNVPSSVSAMNVQTAQSTTRQNNTALGSIISLTCSKAGTYDVYWTCARSSTSGTWGSQLYINGTAYGTENATFNNHVQNNHLTGVTIPANATVAIYGRSRSGYYIYVPQLTIMQTA